MSAHSKGPWSATHNSWEFSTVYDASGNAIAECQIDQSVTEETQEELEPIKEANARLMAAAPDLLQALKRVMDSNCPLTGNPSHQTLVEFWEYEKTQGRGEADDQLFALSAIFRATGK